MTKHKCGVHIFVHHKKYPFTEHMFYYIINSTLISFIGGEMMNDTECYVKNLFDSLFITSPHQLTIHNITEKLKIKTFYWDYTTAIAEWKGKYGLFVNQQLTEQQQWQVFGHEMKHFCFDCGGQRFLADIFKEYQEVKADYFAYHFCIPTFMLERLKGVTANDVARIFNVEFDFALRRLDMYKSNLITVAESCISYD